MPTYAYACKQCGHRFETVQSFAEPSLTECPQCAGPLRKEYGSIGVTFNGPGFYRTDSRSAEKGADSAAKRSGTGTETSTAGGGGDSGSTSTPSKSDSKSESKSDSKPAKPAAAPTGS